MKALTQSLRFVVSERDTNQNMYRCSTEAEGLMISSVIQ
jgi:hypothetical protein